MNELIGFNHKLYRQELVHTLKRVRLKNKKEANNLLINEQGTLRYIVAKKIKDNVFKEVRSILFQNKLEVFERENRYIDEEKKLIESIRNDFNVFSKLDNNLKNNHQFVLKLLEIPSFYLSEQFPKQLFKNKQFILKALEIKIIILTKIDNSFKNDLDIIEKVYKINHKYLTCLDIINYTDLLIKKYNMKSKDINNYINVYNKFYFK